MTDNSAELIGHVALCLGADRAFTAADVLAAAEGSDLVRLHLQRAGIRSKLALGHALGALVGRSYCGLVLVRERASTRGHRYSLRLTAGQDVELERRVSERVVALARGELLTGGVGNAR